MSEAPTPQSRSLIGICFFEQENAAICRAPFCAVRSFRVALSFLYNFPTPLAFLVKTAIIYEKSTFCWKKEMRTFDYVAMKDQKWDPKIVAYIAAIHEAKGKQKLYLKHAPHNIL